jgi:hypothetical protein
MKIVLLPKSLDLKHSCFPRLRGKGASVADVLLNDLLLVADWLLEKVQQLPAT